MELNVCCNFDPIWVINVPNFKYHTYVLGQKNAIKKSCQIAAALAA